MARDLVYWTPPGCALIAQLDGSYVLRVPDGGVRAAVDYLAKFLATHMEPLAVAEDRLRELAAPTGPAMASAYALPPPLPLPVQPLPGPLPVTQRHLPPAAALPPSRPIAPPPPPTNFGPPQTTLTVTPLGPPMLQATVQPTLARPFQPAPTAPAAPLGTAETLPAQAVDTEAPTLPHVEMTISEGGSPVQLVQAPEDGATDGGSDEGIEIPPAI